jgi:hypothetical protein
LEEILADSQTWSPFAQAALRQIVAPLWRGSTTKDVATELGMRPHFVEACLRQLRHELTNGGTHDHDA